MISYEYKNLYDLTSVISFDKFPWEEMSKGIELSIKTDTKFYGYLDQPQDFGKNIFITWPLVQKQSYFTMGEKDLWRDSPNMINFPSLKSWIHSINVFKNTGRILIFLNEPNKSTPPHIDEDLNRAPKEYQHRAEFIWITSPINGKNLIVDDQPASYACWFNNYSVHSSIPQDIMTWSLRIDGKFTDEFKKILIDLDKM
jgi:hypothetical protein